MSELSSSTQIFLLLILLIICVLIIHLLIRKRFNYLPESVAIIYIGGIFGLGIKLYNQWISKTNETSSTTIVQTSSPLLNSNLFFMLFLPPIIFEQGYHLHKGNFFRNLGTISTFAIFGTTINALVTGVGLYLLGIVNLSYKLPWRECFIIGSLNSAIDPVAILSIFQVLNVDQLLYMLVFGESILNDAVAIVLTNVIVESKRQFENINTTKLTAYSMIGLLTSSNLTTIPSITTSVRQRNYNNLIHRGEEKSLYEPKVDVSTLFQNENDNKYPLTNNDIEDRINPDIFNDYPDKDNIPLKKKRKISSKFKRAIQINSTTTPWTTQVVTSIKTLMQISTRFSLMFYSSGFLGLIFGLTSALLTKYMAFDKSSLSLEISLLLLTAYASYMFAELFHLSGIMSILVCGLTMSHYTHENLSTVGRQSITVLFRTISFLAETCVFVYLGLGIFEYQHAFHPKLIFWTILLTLIGRAAHVFPLSFVMNCFRSKNHRITFSMQLIMWFAGLRGAISYALSVHVGQYYGEGEEELKRTLVTTTLVTVLFTILVLGGLTMPVVKFIRRHTSSSSHQRSLESLDDMNLHAMMSKTIQFDDLLNDDENYMHQRKHNINDDDNDNYEIHFAKPNTMKGLEKLNEFYIKPLLIRKSSLKQNDEQDIKQHDRKPLLSSSNGKKSSFIDDLEDDDDDEDGEDELLVVNQLRQENFQLKPINQKSKNTTRINFTSHDT
ncbi:unnamed protein product [Rotaria sordida]|uniref:Sodium/hydrogen exchanger 8 n=1 Tax=Rotaria sordida TaxID=392033 RepID=A0A813UW10_9BILA|nr:unnamed protein product [Rotaria sordida]CAF0834678.1 unnamed protein product [Rotaria sordida]